MGYNSGQHFFRLCRYKDKNRMWRRLFQRFKQGVKCLPGEHVHLINDENLVRPALGWHPNDFTQMVDILHLIIDRKSTRLNSSHVAISYAVFCLKKKK